jgi:hypothetical protein
VIVLANLAQDNHQPDTTWDAGGTMRNRTMLTGISLAIVCACSGSGTATVNNPPATTGGGSSAPATGGVTNAGGNGNTSAAMGGNGNASTGGVVNAGGTMAAAGSSTGGESAVGGIASTGGRSSNGGTSSAGGVAPTGGKSSTGDSASTGGKSSAGGTTSAGGKSSTGGVSVTGGSASTGGKANTGGSSSASTSTIGCTRDGLQSAVDTYLAALKAGDPSLMPTTSSTQYVINDKSTTIAAGQGHFQYAQDPDLHRDFFDVDACRSFSEVICSTWSHPYVLMVVLTVSGGQITKYYVVETDAGDWSFDAGKYLTRSTSEDWSVIPEAERISRADLEAGARAYFKFWGDKTYKVPWGDPCARLEGGSFGAFDTALRDTYDATNLWGSCSVGIPSDAGTPQPREALVDVDMGTVDLLLNLGGSDSHLFRFKKDATLQSRTGFDYGMRYVHTITVQ